MNNTILKYIGKDGKEHFNVFDHTMRLRPIPGTKRGILSYYGETQEIEIISISRVVK